MLDYIYYRIVWGYYQWISKLLTYANMYVIMEHRLLNRNIKVKIRLRSNPTTTSYSFWDLSIKFNVTCRCILIPKHGSEIVITHITHETFHYYFLLLTLPKEA